MNYRAFSNEFFQSNRLAEVASIPPPRSTRHAVGAEKNFFALSREGKNLHVETKTFERNQPFFRDPSRSISFPSVFMVSDLESESERKFVQEVGSKRGGYEDRCGRIARFLWSFLFFFSFFFPPSPPPFYDRGIYAHTHTRA